MNTQRPPIGTRTAFPPWLDVRPAPATCPVPATMQPGTHGTHMSPLYRRPRPLVVIAVAVATVRLRYLYGGHRDAPTESAAPSRSARTYPHPAKWSRWSPRRCAAARSRGTAGIVSRPGPPWSGGCSGSSPASASSAASGPPGRARRQGVLLCSRAPGSAGTESGQACMGISRNQEYAHESRAGA